MYSRDTQLSLRACASRARTRAAHLVVGVLFADIPTSCLYSFCDFLLPDATIICASRDTVAAIHPGSMTADNRVDHTMDHGGDVTDVAAAGPHIVVSRGLGFQVTSFTRSGLRSYYMGDSHASQVVTVDITVGGIVATAAVEGIISLWDLSCYVPPPASRSSPLMLAGHTDCVRQLRFVMGRHGRLLLVSAADDGKVCVWDPLSAACLHVTQFFPHSLRCAAAISTSSAVPIVAVAANAALGIYEWRTGSSGPSGSSAGRLAELVQITAHEAPLTAVALSEGFLCSACENEIVLIHRTTGSFEMIAQCRAKLATRLCASLMSCITKMVFIAAPPGSSAIVIACCSSDGDFIVFTARPPDPRPPSPSEGAPSRSSSLVPNFALKNPMTKMLGSASSALAGAFSTALMNNYRAPATTDPSSPTSSTTSGNASPRLGMWTMKERSSILETGAVLGMALSHVAFS